MAITIETPQEKNVQKKESFFESLVSLNNLAIGFLVSSLVGFIALGAVIFLVTTQAACLTVFPPGRASRRSMLRGQSAHGIESAWQ